LINIFKIQQNILYVCPSTNSGTRERMLLRDSLLLKEVGHNVFVYCLKDSYLDSECSKLGLNVIHHVGKRPMNVFKWHKLKTLRSFFKRIDVNIVHCYELNFLWPVAFFLRKKKLTPLFFTLTNEVTKFYHQFWYKPLLTRLDLIFIPVREMIDTVTTHMDIPQRKIYFSGLGLKKIKKDLDKKELDSNVWNFSCWVNDHEESGKDLSACFEAIWAVNTSFKLKKIAHLHLYSSRKWQTNIITEKLNTQINKLGIEKFVHFHEDTNVQNITSDIWISYNSNTPLEDYTLISMLKGIPTIMPRNATTSEICRFYEGLNLTFKASDSRDLRAAMDKITAKISKGVGAELTARDELWIEHGEEGYKYNLYKIYEKHLNKRKRFYS